MSLLDRLKAAQVVRGEGDEVAEPADSIDLTAAEAAQEVETIPQKKAIWGRPSRCPACSGPGYLDRIDLVNRIMFQHCPNCRERWETPESETVPAETV